MTERFTGIPTEAASSKAAFVRWAMILVLLCALVGCESQQPISQPEPPVRIEQSPPMETPAEPNEEPQAKPPIETAPPEDPSQTPPTPAPVPAPTPAPATLPSGYGQAYLEILPLSELVAANGGTQLNAYVALFDSFGSAIKAPGTLRFELYEYVQRSAEPKGQRVAFWPDIDLADPAQNNRYWQDFLRAYAFELTTDVPRNTVYILEATCIRPDGKRLSADFTLRPEQ